MGLCAITGAGLETVRLSPEHRPLHRQHCRHGRDERQEPTGTCSARDEHPARRSEKLAWWRGSSTGYWDTPMLAAAHADSGAFGRWLLLAEGPFPALPSLVAGRSWAAGSRDSPLRSPLAGR